MTEPRSLLLVGKVRPERKRSLTGMAVAAELPLVGIEESTEAIAWLEANDPACVIVNTNVNRLDKVLGRIRSKRELSHVPVFALVAAPDDLWIEQYFGWGGDDVVQIDAGSTLLERLRAVPRETPKPVPGRRVVIADPDRTRVEVLARVFGLAGFDVRFAIDRQSLEIVIKQFDPTVVIVNSVLGELPDVIARTRQDRSNAAWGIMAARRELEAQQVALGQVPRCFVIGVQSNPWQILLRSNEIWRDEGVERRSEPRRQFGSFVLFRAAGSDDDDVGVAYNLSSRGMFVRTYAPVLSEDVWLEWRVPQDKTRVRLEGKVVWRQTSLSDPSRAASPLGFGVEFCDYLGGARKHLERALEVLDGTTKRGSLGNQPAVPALVASPTGVGKGDRTGADPPVPAAVPPKATASDDEAGSGTPGQAPGIEGSGDAFNALPSVRPLNQTLPLATPVGNRQPISAQSLGIRTLTKPLPQVYTETPKAVSKRPSPDAGAANDGTPEQTISFADSPEEALARPAEKAPPESPPVSPVVAPEPASRQARAKPQGSVVKALEKAAPELPAMAPKKVPPESRTKGKVEEGEPLSTSSVGGAGGTSDIAASQSLAKRQPSPPSSIKTSAPQVSRLNAPPRPKTALSAVVAPPRPGRASNLADTVVGASTTMGIGVLPPKAGLADPPAAKRSPSERPPRDTATEVAVPLADLAHEPVAFDDLGDETSPNVEEGLFEAAPSSSEPTEILGNPNALFEIAEDPIQPTLDVHDDDAPTVVENPGLSPTADAIGATSSAIPTAQGRILGEASFGAEEPETRQWNGPAASVIPAQPFRKEPELSPDEDLLPDDIRPRRRGGGRGLGVGLLVVATGFVGGAYWLYSTGRLPIGEAVPGVSAEQTQPVLSASVAGAVAADGASPAVAVTAASDTPGAESTGSTASDETPWAPVDDGSPLAGYPSVEEFQMGKGRLLADRYGYLVVRFPEAAFIFANNIAMGATNWKIAATCGEKVLRIGVGEKPVTWLSSELRVNVVCRETTRVVFRRLDGVVAPPGVQRPMLPGSAPARKNAKDSEEVKPDGVEAPAPESKSTDAPAPPVATVPDKPPEVERGIVDTGE